MMDLSFGVFSYEVFGMGCCSNVVKMFYIWYTYIYIYVI